MHTDVYTNGSLIPRECGIFVESDQAKCTTKGYKSLRLK